MNKMILLLVVFGFLSLSGVSQVNKEYTIYDSLSRHFFQEMEWDSVIDISKESIYKGHDFYFLRMRLGMAYDQQSNYRLAEINYGKALALKPGDDNAAFYQYHAAINGGRADVAYHRYKSYNKTQKELICGDKDPYKENQAIKLKTIEQISFHSGFSFTNNKTNQDEVLSPSLGVLYEQAPLRNSQFYANVGLTGNISTYLSWNFIYNYKNIKGDYLFREKTYPLVSQNMDISQHEFFGNVTAFKGDGWSFSAYGMLLSYGYDNKKSLLIDYNYYIMDVNDSILGTQPEYLQSNERENKLDYITGFRIKKTINIIDLSLMATYAQMADINPWQIGGEITILPNGSYDFYLTNKLTYLDINGSDELIYKVSTGGNLIEELYFYASATFGDLRYSNELDMGVSYNWTEKTSFKADFGLSYPLNEKIWISAHYQFMQKKANINQYQLSNIIPSSEFPGYLEPHYSETFRNYGFNEHFIYLGILWYL